MKTFIWQIHLDEDHSEVIAGMGEQISMVRQVLSQQFSNSIVHKYKDLDLDKESLIRQVAFEASRFEQVIQGEPITLDEKVNYHVPKI